MIFAFAIPSSIKAALIAIAGVVMLILRYFQKKDANEIPNAVNQARADAVKGDDAALNADLDAARDRMRDNEAANRRNQQ